MPKNVLFKHHQWAEKKFASINLGLLLKIFHRRFFLCAWAFNDLMKEMKLFQQEKLDIWMNLIRKVLGRKKPFIVYLKRKKMISLLLLSQKKLWKRNLCWRFWNKIENLILFIYEERGGGFVCRWKESEERICMKAHWIGAKHLLSLTFIFFSPRIAVTRQW